VRAALTALALALFVAAAMTLTGCGPARQAPAQQNRVTPADVQQREDEVSDIERVVGSAEAQAQADAQE
jgi:hypothetical protein